MLQKRWVPVLLVVMMAFTIVSVIMTTGILRAQNDELISRLENDSVSSIEPWNSQAFSEVLGRGAVIVPTLLESVKKADRRAFLSLEAVRRIKVEEFNNLSPDLRAKIYRDSLANSAFYNSWGLPSFYWEEPAKSFISLGRVAVPVIAPLLTDNRLAPVWGSQESTIFEEYQNRVCDYTFALINEMFGRSYQYPKSQLARDEFVRGLLKELDISQPRMGCGSPFAVIDTAQLPQQAKALTEGLYFKWVAQSSVADVAWARVEHIHIPLHYHDQNVIIYPLHGQVSLKQIDSTNLIIAPGQLVLIPAKTVLSVQRDTSADFLIFVMPGGATYTTAWFETHLIQQGGQVPSSQIPATVDVVKRFAQPLDYETDDLAYTSVYETDAGSVELFRINKSMGLQNRPETNRILYLLKGRAQALIGDTTAEVGPGQIVIIPSSSSFKLERVGKEPVEFILFSSPAFKEGDIIGKDK